MTTTTELIQSYVLEASIAKMIINDANELNENINNVITSLQEIEDERWKYFNAKQLKELEERHYELFDKYYFDDSYTIIRTNDKELIQSVVMNKLTKDILDTENSETLITRFDILEDIVEYLIKCPRFLGILIDVRDVLIVKCNNYIDFYRFINTEKVKNMLKHLYLIEKY